MIRVAPPVPCWTRRARPLLGTLVEVGADAVTAGAAAIEAAFDAVFQVQRRMSRFDPACDIGRFNALPPGGCLAVHRSTARVLALARALHAASGSAFDISQGAPEGWRLDGVRLVKMAARARLDLGGIAKGHAVDRAVAALRRAGATGGWINAGGDLRAFGSAEVPVFVRDALRGGVRAFGTLGDGAFATSRYAADSRCRLHRAGSLGGADQAAVHVSVAAPECVWADALTKIVAATGDASHPLLAAHGGRAWIH